MSNRGEAPQVLAKGVYVVSNGLMSEHWEKQHIYVSALPKSFTYDAGAYTRGNFRACRVGYIGR